MCSPSAAHDDIGTFRAVQPSESAIRNATTARKIARSLPARSIPASRVRCTAGPCFFVRCSARTQARRAGFTGRMLLRNLDVSAGGTGPTSCITTKPKKLKVAVGFIQNTLAHAEDQTTLRTAGTVRKEPLARSAGNRTEASGTVRRLCQSHAVS